MFIKAPIEMYVDKLLTERLLIRPLTVEDIKPWKAFFKDNPSLKFFRFDNNESAQEKSEAWINKQLWRYKESLFGLLALVDQQSGKLIGQCGLLTQQINGSEEIEIGYHVLPELWGKGYATEAAKALKKYAFDKNISDTLVSIIHVDNLQSQRVAEKNGMQRTIQTEFHTLPVYIYRINR